MHERKPRAGVVAEDRKASIKEGAHLLQAFLVPCGAGFQGTRWDVRYVRFAIHIINPNRAEFKLRRSKAEEVHNARAIGNARVALNKGTNGSCIVDVLHRNLQTTQAAKRCTERLLQTSRIDRCTGRAA